MKLPTNRQDAFLRKPDPAVVAVLLFGPDQGLVRERAQTAVTAVLGSKADPFRLLELPVDVVVQDPARLADEAAAISFGGRSVLRLRDAGNGLAAALDYVLGLPTAANLIVLEAGDLPPRSALRQLCEGSERAVAIGCYPADAQGAADLARAMLGEVGITLDPDAEAYLGSSLAGDRQLIRRELEKLIAYAGPARRLDLEAVQAVVGDLAEQDLDDIALSAADGDLAGLERAYARLIAEGGSTIGILRAAQRHFGRLHLALARVEAGEAPDRIAGAMYLHFRVKPRFIRQLGRWRRPAVERALALLMEAETGAKSTGMPDVALVGQALLAVARLVR